MHIIVIGGGIAGTSIGYELAADFDVTLVEAEKSLATHTTGRSAATWIGSYGPPGVRALSAKSLPWLLDPPFDTDGPITSPLTCLWVGRQGTAQKVFDFAQETALPTISGEQAESLHSSLRPGAIELAAFDETAQELDVAALQHGYTKSFRARGGTIVSGVRIVEAQRRGDQWELAAESGDTFTADAVVNAAGAWGDIVGTVFGAAPVGLVPKVRTIFQSSTQREVAGLPFIADITGDFYAKPEGDAMLCSPADQTPAEPGDPKPDELEIARAIDAINETTLFALRSVRTSWAGLRTFAPDGEPYVTWDETVDGFFWFVGQGGFGIQMAPALAEHGAEMIRARLR